MKAKIKKEVVIIGGGPAGMAGAIEAEKNGSEVLLVESGFELGGILNQCIHNGFGVKLYGEELTGPEYAERFIEKIDKNSIQVLLNSGLLSLRPDRQLTLLTPQGIQEIKARAVIVATGARERTRGEIGIPGTRPAGVLTAGTAQEFINKKGYLPGRKALILGSGDIGLIMARRLTWEGAEVIGVAEIMPYPTGLNRNVVQCLHDFDIPLYLKHTVTKIYGQNRLQGVELTEVDDNFKPIEGTQRHLECDTLLLSAGLIPENEPFKEAGIKLDAQTKGPVVDEWFQTEVPGIFACGNCVHVEDLVDWVTLDGYRAGLGAARFSSGDKLEPLKKRVLAGNNVNYVIPHKISGKVEFRLALRVKEPMEGVTLKIRDTDLSFPRRIVTPGEMEVQTIEKKQLAQLKALDEIIVDVERKS